MFAGGATCESCVDARRLAYGDFEKMYGVDLSEFEVYCEKNGGLKFFLIIVRVVFMIVSGVLNKSTLEWLCAANDVEINSFA